MTTSLKVQQMSTAMSNLLQCYYAAIRFLKKFLGGFLSGYDKYLPSLTSLQNMICQNGHRQYQFTGKEMTYEEIRLDDLTARSLQGKKREMQLSLPVRQT